MGYRTVVRAVVGLPLALALAFSVVPPAGALPDVAPADRPDALRDAGTGDDPLSVAELDLDGVSPEALGALPPEAPLPAEDAGPGRAGPQAAGDDPDPGPGSGSPDVLTAELDTEPFTVLGVTWDAAPDLSDVVVRYRVRQDGTWSGWAATGPSDVAPDADGPEAAGPGTRGAIDPVVADDADGLQLWVDAGAGTVTGVTAVLVDPGADPEPSALTTAAVPVPGAPGIIPRAGWGADESMRTCEPEYSAGMVAAAVHHTASANGYRADAVPGILRGILAFHTRPEAAGGRGWCDIGYNFLVDRFGRVFEGRAGGVERTVVGVHTGGFNSRTVGVSAIGDYGSAGVPAAMTDAIVALLSWKLRLHGIDPGGTVSMVSGGGASRYPAGAVATFPAIYGHRDAQLTACPGENLYSLLPTIRARVVQAAGPAGAVSPRGNWDTTVTSPTGFRVVGWALDPQVAGPVTVRVEVDGATAATAPADRPRPDVAALYPALGPAHGFDIAVPRPPGPAVVCLWAGNVADGADVSLGCRRVTVRNAAPIGSLDSVVATATGVIVRGWTLDPDTSDPTEAHVYVDGVGARVVADEPRPDVGAAFGRGDRHGFTHTRTLADGEHSVCLFSIDTSGGPHTLVLCQAVTVGRRVPLTAPIGVLEAVTATNTTVTATGWTLDPDTSDPVAVHVYVDGVGVARTADLRRPDVAAAFGLGDRHGYSVVVPASPGPHRVCAYGINAGPGGHTQLGCLSVVVPDHAPIGAVDAAAVRGGVLTTSGWTLDPDTTAPTDVHVYVDGVGHRVLADDPRPDVAAAFGLGDRHGFRHAVPVGPGRHTVCVFGINTAAGPHTLLACLDVTAP